MSISGFAGDGGVIVDARHDDPDDRWSEMRFRFPQPLTIDGYPVSVIHLYRQPSGDTPADEDLKVYAQTSGDVAAYARDRRLAPVPTPAPWAMNVGENAEDDAAPAFKATYAAWTKPLTKAQARALSSPTGTYVLPGRHRLPALRFAGPLAGAPGQFAFGCRIFGSEASPVEGL
ncbi:hypothetical protein BZL54_14155 [Burkholderia ubonensis subsp. mesacidophila]|uniref:Uncharacterized protein n=1 Tax=Burkholderia ubonensis subsp. mesacidophila TaxID=265293 RepID=A0A2A4FE28_9BURK|nr:hypothetical protein BZL54_14155 [Burkholderia ubonensis subsp. mesacidophila]